MRHGEEDERVEGAEGRTGAARSEARRHHRAGAQGPAIGGPELEVDHDTRRLLCCVVRGHTSCTLPFYSLTRVPVICCNKVWGGGGGRGRGRGEGRGMGGGRGVGSCGPARAKARVKEEAGAPGERQG